MDEQCGQTVNMESESLESGRLLLRRPEANGLRNNNCVVYIKAPSGKNLVFYFRHLQIETPFGCDRDYVEVYEGLSNKSRSLIGKNCGSLPPSIAFTTTSPYALVAFSRYLQFFHDQFELVFTAYHKGKCDNDEYTCNNGRCIHNSLYCNEYNNCGDGSDICALTTAELVGVVVACLFIILLIAIIVAVVFFIRRRRLRRQQFSRTIDFYNSYNSQKSHGMDWFPAYSHSSVKRNDSHRIKLLDPSTLESDHPSAVFDNTDRDPAVWIREYPHRLQSHTAFDIQQPQRSLSFAKGDYPYGFTVDRPHSLYNRDRSLPQRSQSMYVTDGSSASIDKRPFVRLPYQYPTKRSQSTIVNNGRLKDIRPEISSASRSLYQDKHPKSFAESKPVAGTSYTLNDPMIEVPLHDSWDDNNTYIPSTSYPYTTKLELPYPYTGTTQFTTPYTSRQGVSHHKVSDDNFQYAARLPVPIRSNSHARHTGESLDDCIISFRSYPSPVPQGDIALFKPKDHHAMSYDEVDTRLKSRSHPDLSTIYTTSHPRTVPVKRNKSQQGRLKDSKGHTSKVYTSNPHFTDVDMINPFSDVDGNRKRQNDKPNLPARVHIAGLDTIDGLSSGLASYRHHKETGVVPTKLYTESGVHTKQFVDHDAAPTRHFTAPATSVRHPGVSGPAEDRSQGSSDGLYNYDQQQDEIYYPPKSTFRL